MSEFLESLPLVIIILMFMYCAFMIGKIEQKFDHIEHYNCIPK
jgi:hypothetical protein